LAGGDSVKDIYAIPLDIAGKADISEEIANLRFKLEQLEGKHAKEVQRLGQRIKHLEQATP
jgi:hypothetical protein